MTTLEYTSNSIEYNQSGLVTVLGNNQGIYQAALARYDSGSGFFQEFDGEWFLTVLAVAVEFQNISTFGTNVHTNTANRGDYNFMVAINQYDDLILGIIPEPGWSTLGIGLVVVGFSMRRKYLATLG
ncbi:MAG: hypothetical protein EA353_06070 [Puniceicoccaceae bacterium]|nr:MAG: hypothetical protein EA353_06070 [Puniceicoccaceae bacterium]